MPAIKASSPSARQSLISAIVLDLRSQAAPYKGDWKAKWLLSDIEDTVWTLRDGTRLYWHVKLANNSTLADAANKRMRIAAAQITFLHRQLPNFGSSTSEALLDFQTGLLVFIRWMYRREGIYNPASSSFKAIDHHAIREFYSRLALGGAAWALEIPQDLLTYWYSNAIGKAPSSEVLNDPFSIPADDKNAIIDYLKAEKMYTWSGQNRSYYLNRAATATRLAMSADDLRTGHLINAFLRQFEWDIDSPLLITTSSFREFPSHRTPLLEDAQKLGNISHISKYTNAITETFSLYRHLKDHLPEPASLRLPEINRLVKRQLSDPEHTPWMPLQTALAYTAEALRIVQVYGDAIVEGYLNKVRAHLDGCSEWDVPPLLHELNVNTGFTVGKNPIDYSKLRSQPTIEQLLCILVGSVISLISLLKPIRENELANLPVDCVRFVKGDGYWLRQKISKSGIAHALVEAEKPIPRVLARGIKQIRAIQDGMFEIYDYGSPFDRLFYLPYMMGRNPSRMTKLTRIKATRYIDMFCDWTGLPPDEHGRRWYLRVHEARKSFLITFFWTFRYASLDAARWIAGQSDARHVYAYIEANFPGMELPALEAEYAALQLWAYENKSPSEAENVVDLYRSTCKHFKVSAISFVQEKDLLEWLEIAFIKGRLKLEPHSIKTNDGIVGTQICFRISPELK